MGNLTPQNRVLEIHSPIGRMLNSTVNYFLLNLAKGCGDIARKLDARAVQANEMHYNFNYVQQISTISVVNP